MDNDDALIGRLLSRREVLVITGGIGAAAFVAACGAGAASTANAQSDPTASPSGSTPAGASPSPAASTSATASIAASVTPTCVAAPALTEGPYFVDEQLNRSDVRSNADGSDTRAGAALALSFVIYRLSSSGCTAWSDAVVDVWHCDASGEYSDVTDRSFNTIGQNWLRGYQTTDANGVATFTTIYPGWYSGRAVHIHVHVYNASGKSLLVTQIAFPEEISKVVFAQGVYASHGQADTTNAKDNVFGDGVSTELSTVTGSVSAGYVLTHAIVVSA